MGRVAGGLPTVKLAQWIVVLCLRALALDAGIRTPEPSYMVS